MTREGVSRAYQKFIEQMADEMLDVVEEEFGGRILGRVAKRGAKTMAKRIRGEMETQGRIVVAYASAIANDRTDLALYEQRFLETNPVYQRYDGDDIETLEKHLLSHFRMLGTDLAPLVASDKDDFWLALKEEYSKTEAKQIFNRHFSQAETFKQYRTGIFPNEALAKRVIEVIEEGEHRLQTELNAELNRVYD